jgi:hypothetical protein
MPIEPTRRASRGREAMKEHGNMTPDQYRTVRAAGQLELFPPITSKQQFDPDRTRPLPPLPPLPVLEQKLAEVRQEVRSLIVSQLEDQNPQEKELLYHLERSARAEAKMRADVVKQVRGRQGHSPQARVRWDCADMAGIERSRCAASSRERRG